MLIACSRVTRFLSRACSALTACASNRDTERLILKVDRRWYILTHLDGSLSNVVLFAKAAGVRGVWNVWPRPSVEAWAMTGAFGALQALLQLALPGKQHKGPVSPKGNVPVYKAGPVRAHHARNLLDLAKRPEENQ